MSQSGFTPILIYASGTATNVPLAADLTSSASGAELALNYADGKLYYKNSSSVVTLLASTSGASGDVVGPASSTDNALARFDLATGKLIQNSVGILSDAGILTGLTGITSSGSITLSSLTSGRVPYATTAGLLTDSANLTFNGTTLTANTIGAFTLSGTVAGGGNQINNVIIGTSTPLAGAFTTLTASTSITNTGLTSGRVVFSTTNGLETDSANLTFDGTNLTLLGGTANAVTYLNGSKVLTSGSALTFDGTNFATTGTATAAKLIPTGNSATGNGLYLPAANSVGLSTNGTNAVYIDSTQNVGIGTSSPTTLLTVSAKTNDVEALRINALGASGGVQGKVELGFGYYDGGVAPSAAIGLEEYSAASSGGNLLFKTRPDGSSDSTRPTERMRIDSSGNVGIGVSTVATNFRTQFLGTAGSNTSAASSGTTQAASAVLRLQAGGGFTATLDIGQGGGTGSWLQSCDTGNLATTYPLLLNPVGGNVGIGTSSPAFKLQVAGSGSQFALISTTDTTSTTGLLFGDSGSNAIGRIEYVHSSDLMQFYTSGSAKVYIDSSGNVGIGVTPSAWDAAVYTALQISTNSSIASFTNGETRYSSNCFYNTSTWKYITSSQLASAYTQGAGAHTWFTAPSGTAGNAITFTQAMTLDSSGLLLIGTTSNTGGGRVDALSNATSAYTARSASSGASTTVKAVRSVDSGASNFANAQYDALSHAWQLSAGTAAMTLDSSGNLLVGHTAPGVTNTKSIIADLGADGYLIVNHSGAASGSGYQYFGYNGGVIGSITQSGTTAVLYNLTSDQRLKENIQDADSASALIDSIHVRKFDWITDKTHQRYGFIAQELVAVAPEAVHQPTDPEEMMAVDYSKLVPMLVKEIQSLRKRLTALEST